MAAASPACSSKPSEIATPLRIAALASSRLPSSTRLSAPSPSSALPAIPVAEARGQLGDEPLGPFRSQARTSVISPAGTLFRLAPYLQRSARTGHIEVDGPRSDREEEALGQRARPDPLRPALPRAGAGDPRLRAAARRRSGGRRRRRRRDLPGRLAAPRRGADRRRGAALALRRWRAGCSPTCTGPSGGGPGWGERLAETLRTELATHPAPAGEAAEVLRAMGELGDDDRELLLLVSWEELSPGEAARVLGISALAARSRLHRARRRLRALLEQRESAGAADRNSTWRKQDEDA